MVTGLAGNETLRPEPKIELLPERWRRDWLKMEAGAIPGRKVITVAGVEEGGGGVEKLLDMMKSQQVKLLKESLLPRVATHQSSQMWQPR